MGEEFEAAGQFATGALLARSVDSETASAGPQPDAAHGICLNCGTALVGAHCHRCGQSGHVHRSLGAIWHEILHGVVHFEGKMWRTLPMLAWRPGELTRRYIGGERARFVSPMALFLFSVFTLFATLSILGIAPPSDFGMPNAELAAGISEQRVDVERRLERATVRRDDAGRTAEERQKAAADVARYSEALSALSQVEPVIARNAANDTTYQTGWKRLDKGIEKLNRNPGLAMYKLQANSYKFSWLLIPLSVPFVWLMFAWKRQFRVYDHAVFVTYSIAFMSLLFIVLTIFAAIFPGDTGMAIVSIVAMIVPPIHIYRQLRGAYSLRRRSAIARMLVLCIFINVIAVLFLVLVLGLGLVS
ncbi:DUF3667 domain-containing protein [Sphingomonas sp.]